MKPEVDKWLSELTDQQREIALDLREIVRSHVPKIQEEIKWNQLCFYGRSLVCYIQKATRHVSLGFGRGAKLTDPAGLLKGSGAQMRHVKVPFGGEANREALIELVKEAAVLDRSE